MWLKNRLYGFCCCLNHLKRTCIANGFNDITNFATLKQKHTSRNQPATNWPHFKLISTVLIQLWIFQLVWMLFGMIWTMTHLKRFIFVLGNQCICTNIGFSFERFSAKIKIFQIPFFYIKSIIILSVFFLLFVFFYVNL